MTQPTTILNLRIKSEGGPSRIPVVVTEYERIMYLNATRTSEEILVQHSQSQTLATDICPAQSSVCNQVSPFQQSQALDLSSDSAHPMISVPHISENIETAFDRNTALQMQDVSVEFDNNLDFLEEFHVTETLHLSTICSTDAPLQQNNNVDPDQGFDASTLSISNPLDETPPTVSNELKGLIHIIKGCLLMRIRLDLRGRILPGEISHWILYETFEELLKIMCWKLPEKPLRKKRNKAPTGIWPIYKIKINSRAEWEKFFGLCCSASIPFKTKYQFNTVTHERWEVKQWPYKADPNKNPDLCSDTSKEFEAYGCVPLRESIKVLVSESITKGKGKRRIWPVLTVTPMIGHCSGGQWCQVGFTCRYKKLSKHGYWYST